LPQNTDHNALVMFRIPLFPCQFRGMANPGGIQARSRALPGKSVEINCLCTA
jgi:hypothetical protein